MNSHKTAITRNKVSRPVRELESWFTGRILDYGCGKGTDAAYLKADKFDPYYYNVMVNRQYDVVLNNYVVNTISHSDRVKCIKTAFKAVKKGGILIITARPENEIEKNAKQGNWKVYEDGYLTSKNTFQKGFNIVSLATLVKYNLEGFKIVDQGQKNYIHIIVEKL